MLHLLRRHPFPVSAYFEHCLVLTYGFPVDALMQFVPAGMTLDTWNGLGFIAAAFVQTRSLRPTFLPSACGQDFFLSGYRVFVKYRTNAGRSLRGLRILRSDADRRAMVLGGNLLTHYNYSLCRADVRVKSDRLSVHVRTPGREADVDVTAFLGESAGLPPASPFPDERAARRFEGPMPYTLDYEARTNSVVRIKGTRPDWNPRLVRVDVRELTFVESGPFAGRGGRLASAFHVEGISYRWERGIAERLERSAA